MDCMKSFIISMDRVNVYSAVGTLKTWAVGAQHFWTIQEVGLSTFRFQGFKNVEIYGVDVVGGIQTDVANVTNGVVVSDWNFEFLIDGQLPLTSGFIDTVPPNFWSIEVETTNSKRFSLSKNTNSLRFANPITSAQSISFEALNAQGIGGQNLLAVSLYMDLSFIVYYKFEGE